jgi:hypothetical protein
VISTRILRLCRAILALLLLASGLAGRRFSENACRVQLACEFFMIGWLANIVGDFATSATVAFATERLAPSTIRVFLPFST